MSVEQGDLTPFETWNRRDMEGWVSLFHPDCEFISALEASVEGDHLVYRGRAGLEQFVKETWNTWKSLDLRIAKTHREGNTVIAEGSFSAMGKESGAAVEREAWWVNRYRGEQIIWSRAFFEREAALAAARQED